MAKKLAMIHTVVGIAKMLEERARKLMPDVEIINIVNDALLKILMQKGALDSQIKRAVCMLVLEAEKAGADAVLLTCSSISPCADVARELVSIPVFRIDEPMAGDAARRFRRVGVAATVRTTLAPTAELIKRKAELMKKKVFIKPVLCKGAFEALMRGDTKKHDKIVTGEIAKLSEKVDVIVLAQASMARLQDSIKGITVPVLSSPESGLKQVKKYLSKMQ